MPPERLDHPVARRPAPGVVCAAELPGLDGYTLTIGPREPEPERPGGVTGRDGLAIADNDPELTAALIDDALADHLGCLRRTARTLVLFEGRVQILGDDVRSEDEADLADAVARLCLRPVQLARRLTRLFRPLGGVASAARWDTSAYAIALSTAPRVRVDWPRRPGLVTRITAESTARGTFQVIDTRRGEARAGATAALELPGVARDRYLCVAHDDDALARACARLEPSLPLLAAAEPVALEVGDSAVDVRFLGLELQRVAIDPAVDLVRTLAGPGTTPGPYR